MAAGSVLPEALSLTSLRYVATIAAFLILNSSLNLVNRYLLGPQYGFKFPILLTMAHLSFGFTVLLPLMLTKPFWVLHRATWERQWRGISSVASFKVANIVLNNMSLVYITLSLNQIIRSSIPVLTAFLGVFIERKIPTRFELASLITLSTGVMISVWEGGASGSMWGIIVCVCSVVSGAAMLNFSGAVLSEKLDVLRLTFYTAPISVGILVPFYIMQEHARAAVYFDKHGYEVWWYILLGGINAVLYNIVHYSTIQLTSAVTTPVIGMVKVIGLVVLSAVFLGEWDIFNLRMTVGCTLALLGFGMYSYAKYSKVSAAPKPAGYSKVSDADEESVPEQRRAELKHVQ